MFRRVIMYVLQCSVGGVSSSRRLSCQQLTPAWFPRRLSSTRRRAAYTLRRYPKLVYRTPAQPSATVQSTSGFTRVHDDDPH